MENSKEKQIEEMAKDLGIAFQLAGTTHFGTVAEVLVNAGYRKASDFAEEIFAEIEEIRLKHIKKYEFFRNGSIEEIERKYYEGAEWGLRQMTYFLAELKKKYTEAENDSLRNSD